MHARRKSTEAGQQDGFPDVGNTAALKKKYLMNIFITDWNDDLTIQWKFLGKSLLCFTSLNYYYRIITARAIVTIVMMMDTNLRTYVFTYICMF